MNQYYREITPRLLQLASQFPALILTGARQTGKTTLLKQIFPKHQYASLDLPSLAEQAEKEPEAFLKKFPPPVLIDEAQYAPGLFRHLKVAIDNNRELRGQFILAGSQKFNLMREIADSLAGRCVRLELEGLSVNEIFSKASKPILYREIIQLLVRGSLPELWKYQNIDATEYYRSYLATYLERDVRQLLHVSSLRDFERFLRICATRSGQLLNKSV